VHSEETLMPSPRWFTWLLALACLVPVPSFAQQYPDKAVHMLVGFSPGGFTDVLARLLAQRLQERLHQPFVVENKPGAAGTIAADFVAKAKPDGYTILMGHSNSNSIAPALYPKLPYDVIKDFTPIVLVASTPFMLTVHPSVPATDVKSFVEYAKTHPLRYASSGQGSGQHLAAEQFILMTKVPMTHIPYKGSGQAITDLLSGQVELNFESPPNTLQYIKTGKLKALGITSAKRSSLLPDVPTIAEQGLPGYEIIQWFGVFGPPGMPKPIVDKLNAEINAIMKAPDFAEKVASQGGVLYGGTPESFAAYIRSDVPKWDKLVKTAGIKLD
jgi:tripartite-type tricarboxylate transporter receptor subunit TctC